MDAALNPSAGGAPANGQPARWSGVFAMTLCVFALIASEFLPVSLLTPIAGELHVSQEMAGQGITISAVFAVLTSLFLAVVAGGVNRKTLLLALTGLMSLSGIIVALAPNYLVYMVGRALIGVVVGGFWSMSAATAIRLVPKDQVPKALALFNSGNALATVVAAPLGSYLGSVIGWRGAFFCLVPVALLAFVWQFISLPDMRPESRTHSTSALGLLKRPFIALGALAVSVFFMGQFALFTYVRPFLENVTHVNTTVLSLTLLTMGIAGFVGTAAVGIFRKKGPYFLLISIPLVMAAIAAGLIFTGAWLLPVTVLLGVWSLVAIPAPVGWWSWIARTLPNDAEAGGGLMVAVVQLAIGTGSMLGGLLFDRGGHQSTFAFSAATLAIASLLAYATARFEKTTSTASSRAST